MITWLSHSTSSIPVFLDLEHKAVSSRLSQIPQTSWWTVLVSCPHAWPEHQTSTVSRYWVCGVKLNPRRMRGGLRYSRSVSEWVCVSVTALLATYFVSMSQMRCCKVRVLASFTGHRHVSPDELLMDNDGFFSTQRVCMARDRSNKTTGSSLIVAHWQISFLAYANCWHGTS